MRYKIPEGLSCEHCTLQWYWGTGNSCLYDEGYLKYFQHMQDLGWDAKKWSPNAVTLWAEKQYVCCGVEWDRFAEEFWNCADIKVLPGKYTTTHKGKEIFIDALDKING